MAVMVLLGVVTSFALAAAASQDTHGQPDNKRFLSNTVVSTEVACRRRQRSDSERHAARTGVPKSQEERWDRIQIFRPRRTRAATANYLSCVRSIDGVDPVGELSISLRLDAGLRSR
jgi:hypothetical protein